MRCVASLLVMFQFCSNAAYPARHRRAKFSVQRLQMINSAWHVFPSSLLGFAVIGSTLFCNLGQALGYMASYSIQYITADRDGQSLALKAIRRHFIFQSTAHHGRHQVCMHLDSAAWLAMHHSRHLMAFIK